MVKCENCEQYTEKIFEMDGKLLCDECYFRNYEKTEYTITLQRE